ncbi:hypothetical protein L596_027989 [Steinernema carpocapsae]|uniref:Piezo TM1-24 domain-containing protein n=1 Tax=Steinernema carpocapsae TaxID=34508 RepID=A0A4U5LX43_STECR|nr:hypothetical protein L596_027989 [Steinernema carpocapsae]
MRRRFIERHKRALFQKPPTNATNSLQKAKKSRPKSNFRPSISRPILSEVSKDRFPQLKIDQPLAMNRCGRCCPKRFLTCICLYSLLVLGAQLIFNLLIQQNLLRFLRPNYKCGGASQVLRQIGFENIRQANSLLIVRIFFPEVIVLTACCILLLRVKFQKTQKFSEESVSDVPSQSEIDEQEEWKQFLSNQKLRSYLDHAQNVLTCVLCAVSGCIFPSILNAVYFVTFVFIATSWAFHRRTLTQRMCSHTCRWLLPYMAFHLILLYAFQFPFIQRFIIPHGVVARLFGLIQYLRYPCEKLPYPIEVIVWRWTEFAMPAVVFVSYTALAVVMVLKREQFEIVISKANGGLTSPVHELRAQSLISPTDSKTHDEDYINIEKSRSLDISRVRRGEEPRRASLVSPPPHTNSYLGFAEIPHGAHFAQRQDDHPLFAARSVAVLRLHAAGHDGQCGFVA